MSTNLDRVGLEAGDPRDWFPSWPAAHLRVLAAGIDDLLGMKAAARKALADRETRRQVWEDAHPGRSYPTQREARAIAAA